MAAPTAVSSSTDATVDRDLADASAVACAAAAGVHAALVLPHAHESGRLAAAFVLATLALGIASLALATAPGPEVYAASAAVLLAVALAYLLSRTTGLPGLAHDEPFDVLGVATSSVEAATAVLALRQLNRNPNRRRTR
jgi:hypothetical protein